MFNSLNNEQLLKLVYDLEQGNTKQDKNIK